MPSTKSEEKAGPQKGSPKKRDRATEIADTFEWLITAFILAFVFRAFVMEAFRIPTGSMADTLKGAHFRLRCVQCGFSYQHGFVPNQYYDRNGNSLPEDTVPGASVRPPQTRCPNCGHCPPAQDKVHVANGDRILVLKCIYQFFEPKRWDVIVFKNPGEPHINYIKRLIGLPGDELQIIDGDVYVAGEICRKPPRVQNELWMPVYDNDYQPVRPDELTFNLRRTKKWRQPFRNEEGSQWVTAGGENPTLFTLDSPGDQVNTIAYDRSENTAFQNFQTTYAYNSVGDRREMPLCSDLMVRFYARCEGSAGRIGMSLSKYGTNYIALFDPAGEMVITSVFDDNETVLVREAVETPIPDKWTLVRFANVDHQLIFELGDKKISYDLGLGPLKAGPREVNKESQVKIFGSGKLTLSHIAIFRDTHYTKGVVHHDGKRRASEDNPFVLGPDEFFALGDNSPNSQDSRWWTTPPVTTKGRPVSRAGVVPRHYLVGKALYVYWPSGFKPFDKFPLAAIPNVGKMRFIYGGSSQSH